MTDVLRGRSPLRNARSPWRASVGWTPAVLGLRALYDYRNADTDGMYDQSGNGRAAATPGGGANSPLWLPYTVPQVYFPGTAGNTVSCTAPANTASYSAQPVGGGAPTTGAASAGAFAFGASNAGTWESVSLLNAGGTELARFSAASCTQTGHTDGYSVAWSVNRSSSGAKTVVQSPAARSDHGIRLFWPARWLDLPAAAVPPLGASAVGTVFLVCRSWPTASIDFGRLFSAEASLNVGLYIATRTAGTLSYQFQADGSTAVGGAGPTRTAGARWFIAQQVNGRSATGLSQIYNNGTATSVNNAAVGDTTATVARIGAIAATGGGGVEMEFEAIVTADRLFTSTELGQLQTFYKAA